MLVQNKSAACSLGQEVLEELVVNEFLRNTPGTNVPKSTVQSAKA